MNENPYKSPIRDQTSQPKRRRPMIWFFVLALLALLGAGLVMNVWVMEAPTAPAPTVAP